MNILRFRSLLLSFFGFVILILSIGCGAAGAARSKDPRPTPSPRQLAWHEMEYYAFVHFNMNTFTGEEWGSGKEDEKLFHPTNLDCEQWASICKDAGMKGIIITAKHHDGFCLWPSKYTKHSVASSEWLGGKGDVLRSLSDACKKFGLKMGIYLSPWDRNSPLYGDSPKYNEFFKNQLREVLTNYGPIFEVWFDGACGEGPNGKKQVYDWNGYINVVRECQPGAVIFSDAGPDIRWIGNENGLAEATNWSTLHRDRFYPGTPEYKQLTEGHEDGPDWVPSECDVSIRPGWYYHQEQDDKVKSVDQLLDIYYRSVGRNSSLLLNLPVDRRGIIHENDAARLMEFKNARESAFRGDVARSAKNSDELQTLGILQLTWPAPVKFDKIALSEEVEDGQRIQQFSLEARSDGIWKALATGTTVGHKRILLIDDAEASEVRLMIHKSKGAPKIRSLQIYAPSAKIGKEEPGVIPRESYLKPVLPFIAPKPGLNYRYYEGTWSRVGYPPAMEMVASGIANNVDFSIRKRDADFALEFSGFFDAPLDGLYQFRFDGGGASFMLHQSMIINKDGANAKSSRNGSIALFMGLHPMAIHYHHEIGTAAPKLEYKVNGCDWKPIEDALLKH